MSWSINAPSPAAVVAQWNVARGWGRRAGTAAGSSTATSSSSRATSMPTTGPVAMVGGVDGHGWGRRDDDMGHLQHATAPTPRCADAGGEPDARPALYNPRSNASTTGPG